MSPLVPSKAREDLLDLPFDVLLKVANDVVELADALFLQKILGLTLEHLTVLTFELVHEVLEVYGYSVDLDVDLDFAVTSWNEIELFAEVVRIPCLLCHDVDDSDAKKVVLDQIFDLELHS
jgi:hypothetical protein